MTLTVLLDAAVRSTLLLGLAFLAARLPRRASAAYRHRVWTAALLGMTALPIAAAIAPAWTLAVPSAPAPPPAPVVATATRDAAPRVPTAPPELPAFPSESAIATAPAPSPEPVRDPWVWIWAAGFLIAGFPAVVGLVLNFLSLRASVAAGEEWTTTLAELQGASGPRRRVALRIGAGGTIPSTWGLFRPVVLLPAEAASWPESTRRAVLAHELAHIRRNDAATHLLSRLAVAAYWFQPLAWYALYRLRVECEHACDDAASAAVGGAGDYAERLVEVARRLRAPRLGLGAAVGMAHAGPLEGRLRALFDAARSHAPLGRSAGASVFVVGLALATLLATARVAPRVSAAPAPAPMAFVAPVDPVAPEEPSTPVKVPDGTPRRLTGRATIDADGAPAAGADVVLWWPPRRDEADGKMSGSILKTTKAGPDGSFAFDAAPGRYRVWATLGDLATPRDTVHCVATVVPEGDEPPKPVELRLKPAVAVTTVVKARDGGRPIPGATIEMGWGVFPEEFTTDDRGVARIFPLSADRWHLRAVARGFASEARWLNLENGRDARVEFPMGAGGDLRGVVRDPSGRPVGGVGISVRVPSASSFQYAWVVSDPDGRYLARSVPRDADLKLSLSKDGYDRVDVPVRVEGEEASLDLTIAPRPFGGAVAGVVIDQQGRAVADARVTNMGTSSDEVRETRSGPDGAFRLDDLYRGTMRRVQVLVRAPGFQARRVDVEPGPADRPGRATIALEPGHRIRGRVVDEAGKPLAGVRIAYDEGANPFGDGGTGTTDADGRFAFDDLPPKCPFGFARAGYSDLQRDDLPLDGPDVIEVRMAPAGVILGRAVDGSGAPLRSFRVRLNHSPLRKPGEPSAGLWSELVDPGQEFQSDDGRFQLGDLPVGTPLLVKVSAPGHEDAISERVVVARPADAREGEYRLMAIDPASVRTYAGRLLRADGKPAVGAELRLIASRPAGAVPAREGFRRPLFNWDDVNIRMNLDPSITRFEEAVADAEGRFAFPSVPRGALVSLYWRGEGVPPGSLERLDRRDDAAAAALDVKLDPPARVVVTVDRAKRPKFASVDVRPRRPEGPSRTVAPGSDDQSLFEIGDLAAGVYDLYLLDFLAPLPGGPPGAMTQKALDSRHVTLKAGETLRIELP